MTFTLTSVVFLLFAHFYADFRLQTDWQATNKSSNNWALTKHVGAYSAVMAFVTLNLTFGIVTFVCHWLTDYVTSRLNARMWAAGRRHDFFVGVGFDQWLHQLQLLTTLWWLGGL